MATLVLHAPGASPSFFPLVKPLTTIAAAADSDVRLPDLRGVITIQFDGSAFTATALGGAHLVVNGKKRGQHALAEGDTLQLGETQVIFQAEDRIPAPAEVSRLGRRDPASLATAKLADFARVLAKEPGTDHALTLLLDSLIEVVRADKGFVLVMNDGLPQVLRARNFQRENVADAVERLSDTIVKRVIETRLPLRIEDALHDAEFNASESVVNLKLSSVLCLPLLLEGELLGAIYLGNDKLANLFTDRELEVAQSFCSTATLLVELGRQLDDLRADKQALIDRLDEAAYGDIIGSCDPMRDIFRKIDKVAATDISVMVTGETGTGKELIAREIHRRSPRKNGAFVAINCGAIPENLLESELFGHAKGAFTGAVATRIGRFQAANGGTLFLDEIGEMPLATQAKLLRVVESREVMRLGSLRPKTVDVRFVAAMTRTSTGTAVLAPTRRTVRVSIARRSFGCSAIGISPISSRKSVPPFASSKTPLRFDTAPVNAPRTWPKSSLSKSVSGMAPQSTGTKGPDARGDAAWTERATTSLPVPVSPWTRSVEPVVATRSRTA